ncbi:MAG TPA: WYL domain-containing protein [Noviherbaspirillum sp.]|nr:WYL domain-containing protein [Noviherbaspirillum sp.]
MDSEKRQDEDAAGMLPKGCKQDSGKTLVRRMKILSLLPVQRRGNKGRSAREICTLLKSTKYAAGIRTIERDLLAMSSDETVWREVGIELLHQEDEEDGRTTCWSHSPKSKALLFQAMSEEDAAMLALLDQELKFLLPPSVAQSFQHYLDQANEVLSRSPTRGAGRFKDRMRAIPDGPPRVPPEINMDHVHEISDALFHEEQLDMTYHASKNDSVNNYRLHPIGLLHKGIYYYLVAMKDRIISGGDGTPQTFRVDRILTIKRRAYDLVERGLPSLDDAIRAGVAQVSDGKMIAIQLHIRQGEETKWVRNRFVGAPLSVDQSITPLPDGSFVLSATVRNSRELVNLLQEVAHYVDVLEPVSLREKIDSFVEQAVALRRNRQ